MLGHFLLATLKIFYIPFLLRRIRDQSHHREEKKEMSAKSAAPATPFNLKNE